MTDVFTQHVLSYTTAINVHHYYVVILYAAHLIQIKCIVTDDPPSLIIPLHSLSNPAEIPLKTISSHLHFILLILSKITRWNASISGLIMKGDGDTASGILFSTFSRKMTPNCHKVKISDESVCVRICGCVCVWLPALVTMNHWFK